MVNVIALRAHVPESKYHPLIVSVSDCPTVEVLIPAQMDLSPISNDKAYRLKVPVDAATAEKISCVEAAVLKALGARGKEWFAAEEYSPDDHLVPAVRSSSRCIDARFMIDKVLPAGTGSVDLYVTHMVVSETGLKLMWTFSSRGSHHASDKPDPEVEAYADDLDADARAMAERLSRKVTRMNPRLRHAHPDPEVEAYAGDDFDADASAMAERLARKVDASKNRVTRMIARLQHAHLDDQADWLLKHRLM